jgi:hypothetical protein
MATCAIAVRGTGLSCTEYLQCVERSPVGAFVNWPNCVALSGAWGANSVQSHCGFLTARHTQHHTARLFGTDMLNKLAAQGPLSFLSFTAATRAP